MINFVDERNQLAMNYTKLCENSGLVPNESLKREIINPTTVISDGIDLIFMGNHKLNFSSRLDDQNLRLLLTALEGFEELIIHIDFSFNNLTTESMGDLSRLLECSKNLQSLNLQYNEIKNEGLLLLSAPLSNLDNLLYLNLETCELETDGLMTIVEILSTSKSLSELNISNNRADHDGIIAVTSVLNFNNESLKTLNIDSPVYSSIGQESSVHIAKMLKRNKILEKLSLRKHGFSCDGIEVIADHLMSNTKLRVLDLTANKISFKGCQTLATYLMGEYCVLQSLILASNRTSHYGAKAIANALTKNTTLVHLDMTKNEIDDKGLYFLAAAMRENMNLVSLKLYWNEFGQESLEAFHDLLTSSRKNEFFFDFTTYIVDNKYQLAYVENELNYDINVSKRNYYPDEFTDENYEYEEDDMNDQEQQIYDELEEGSAERYNESKQINENEESSNEKEGIDDFFE